MPLILIFTLSFSSLGWSSPPDWKALIDKAGGAAVFFGTDLQGPAPYDRNVSAPFAPASNAKIFTATAAIETLGADYTFPTVLQWTVVDDQTAGSVRLVGEGDPSWGITEFNDSLRTRVDAIAAALAGLGIKQIHGEVTAEPADARWDRLRYPMGWLPKDTITCEGGLPQAFNLNMNCGSLTVVSPTEAHWTEQGLTEPVQLQIKVAKVTRLSVRLVNPETPEKGFVIEGTLKHGSRAGFRLPILNVKSWVRNLLVISFSEHGIRVLPKVTGEYETLATRELRFESPPLALLIKGMLKNSINLIAEDLQRTLGLHFGLDPHADLVTSGKQMLSSYLLAVGVPNEFTLNDGSGLSRQSQITPLAMLSFLSYAKKIRGFATLWDGLPIAGFDGTLRNRMKGTAAQNKLRAKTGTLDGVYNLSGYVPSGTDFIPFVMLTRTTVARGGAARSAEDRVGATLSGLAAPRLMPVLGGEEIPFPYVPEHAGQDDQ